jgi:hypothetical protein
MERSGNHRKMPEVSGRYRKFQEDAGRTWNIPQGLGGKPILRFFRGIYSNPSPLSFSLSLAFTL